MSNRLDENPPKVFTNHTVTHGLRFDPKRDCRVVYLPDVGYFWVRLNIVPQYRAPYILRLCESLTYLRSFTPAERHKYFFRAPTSPSSGTSSGSMRRVRQDKEPIMVAIDLKEKTLRLDGPLLPLLENRLKEPFPIKQTGVNDREMMTLMKAHKIVPGNESNVDRDLWRLHELWELLQKGHEEEEQDNDDNDDADRSLSGSSSSSSAYQGDDEQDAGLSRKKFRRGGNSTGTRSRTRPDQVPAEKSSSSSSAVSTKCKRSSFPTRPRIHPFLEDDVQYLRSTDSGPTFDCFVHRVDYGVAPLLPIVVVESLRGGRMPAVTPTHKHTRLHKERHQQERFNPHQRRGQGQSRGPQLQRHGQGRSQSQSRSPKLQQKRRRNRGPKSSSIPAVSLTPPIANSGNQRRGYRYLPQIDPQPVNEEVNVIEQEEQANDIVQEEEVRVVEQEEALIRRRPLVCTGVATTASTQTDAAKEQEKVKAIEQEEAVVQRGPFILAGLATTAPSQPPPPSAAITPPAIPAGFRCWAGRARPSAPPPTVSLDRAHTLWKERGQQQDRRDLYTQYRDPSQSQNNAQTERDFLTLAHTVFGLGRRRTSSIVCGSSFPSAVTLS
ncbi:hypothetical protein BGW39_004752 [Mortierella sp. 14UC]|nr:hypothetical protein BGW39_004752 [Mortierella sp. 14UC]